LGYKHCIRRQYDILSINLSSERQT
jgi:hypothetical protein